MKAIVKGIEYFVGAAALSASMAANAYVINFDPLIGVNGAVYAGHSEGGFAIAPIAGVWSEAHVFGNPVPDIAAGPEQSTVRVTGGTFTFAGVDLADATFGIGTADWEIHGFLGAAELLTMSGSNLAGGGVFTTILSSNSSVTLDRIEITLLGEDSTANIDNIVVNANVVPLPGTLALLGLGLAGLGLIRRRKA